MILSGSEKNDVMQEAKALLEPCVFFTQTCAETLFPHHFAAGFTSLHDQMIQLLDSDAQKICIAAPRGLGKTTTILFGIIARMILFNLVNYVVYISNTSTIAEQQTENLKREFMSNEFLRKVFGPVKVKGYDIAVDYEESYTRAAWVAYNRTMILPRGAKQQVRGILYDQYRPDLIIYDDLENKKLLESETQRAQLKEWFWSEPMNCVSSYDKKYKYIYIDTLKHGDSLMQQLLDDPEWESIQLEACDDNLNPTAPAYKDKEEIKRLYDSHKRHGLLDVFYREFRNIAIAKENASFRSEYFKYFTDIGDQLICGQVEGTYKSDISLPRVLKSELINIVLVDPAKTTNMNSAESAIVGVSIATRQGVIFIRDIIADKLEPDELQKETLAMVRKLRAEILGVEVTGLNSFISQPFRNALQQERMMCEYHELNAQGNKDYRIKSMVPHYRQGYVYHNKTCCTALENQLLTFPASQRKDIMDALGYLPKVMEDFSIYFEPEKNASLMQVPEEMESVLEQTWTLPDDYDQYVPNYL